MHLRQPLMAGIIVVSFLVIATPVTAASSPTFAIHLHEDGSADVAVTYAFDLDSASERAAFEELRDNQSARDAYATRFRDRLGAVAANAADRTGRDMRVANASIGLSTADSTGIATLRVTWHRLAAVEDDRLVVTEPFASGYEPNREFVVVLPDGYTADAKPSADSTTGGRLSWAAGTTLDGFRLTASTVEGSDTAPPENTSGGSGPGLGAGVAVVALGVVGFLARRRS